MYQALYRKWRPKVFDDVVGQEHITSTLKSQIETHKTAHAYLFTGSRGTGKTTCSKILAKAVNCPNVHDGNPCGVCEICTGVDDGTLLDVVEIDAASNNGVDNIRELRDEANFTPAVAKKRVYIIDEAHMLSTGAFNALLKIMEEPPEHVLFILATTEVHKVPATVVSRCQRFDFKRIDTAAIAKRIKYVSEMEKISITDDAADAIAVLSDGGMRDALSLLDMCSAYSEVIDESTVTQCAGIVGREYLFEIANAVLNEDHAKVLETVNVLYQKSISVEKLCDNLISHFRGLMIAKTVDDISQFVACLPEEVEKIKQQAQSTSLSRIMYILECLQETSIKLSKSSAQRIDLEMCLFKMCSLKSSTSVQALTARIEALEDKLKLIQSGAVPVNTKKDVQPSDNTQQHVENNVGNSPQIHENDMFLTDEDAAAQIHSDKAKSDNKPSEEKLVKFKPWSNVVARLKGVNPALAGALKDSKAYESGDLLLIETDNMLFLQLMRQNDYARKSIREALMLETGKRFRLGPYKNQNVEKEEKNPLDIISKRAIDTGIPVDIVE